MQQGKSLSQLAAELENRQARKQDFVVPANQLRVTPTHDQSSVRFRIPEQSPIDMTNHAHGQIASFTGVPKRYYDRMLEEMPWLLADNVNAWFEESDKRRMVRTLDGDLRALLSDSYRRIENEQVAQAALEPLMEMQHRQELQVLSCDVTDHKLYIQARFPKLEGEVKTGDAVQAGLIITNSEVGLGQMEVRPIVYRLVCANGMVLPRNLDYAQMRRRHTGRRVQAESEDYSIYTDETLQADDQALMLKVRDTVTAMSNREQFDQLLTHMNAAAQSGPVANPVKAVEELGKAFQLPETPRQRILEALIRDGDYSKWGMANAVTNTAHDAEDYDSSVEMEELGGRVITLGQADWKRVAEAA